MLTVIYLARKRRRLSHKRNLEKKKVSKSQRQHMIAEFINFRDDKTFTDYKIIVDGKPVSYNNT